jgi:hypothetical protein
MRSSTSHIYLVSELKPHLLLTQAKMPATDIDDGTLRHMLEQADGNVEQALRQIRQMTGDEELEDTGYKLDAGSNDVGLVCRCLFPFRFQADER